jgi:hypothetical protein
VRTQREKMITFMSAVTLHRGWTCFTLLVFGVLGAGCTSPNSSANAVTNAAPKPCAAQSFHLRQVTPVSEKQAAIVVGGHLPGWIPRGFGVQEVDRVEPGHLGYVAWTDTACHRLSVTYAPGVTSISSPVVHAFGPWMRFTRCGLPRPCTAYQGGVNGGLITFITSGVQPSTATTILHTVNTGTK